MLIYLVPATESENVLQGLAYLCASFCTGIGTLGPGISSGRTAASACSQIAYCPEAYGMLSRASMFAQGLIETSAIYAVLIGIAFIYYVT
jgi:F0F1-type ATP synthase membrane subunit c/vacuolar-type H+-ATPase subunit K